MWSNVSHYCQSWCACILYLYCVLESLTWAAVSISIVFDQMTLIMNKVQWQIKHYWYYVCGCTKSCWLTWYRSDLGKLNMLNTHLLDLMSWILLENKEEEAWARTTWWVWGCCWRCWWRRWWRCWWRRWRWWWRCWWRRWQWWWRWRTLKRGNVCATSSIRINRRLLNSSLADFLHDILLTIKCSSALLRYCSDTFKHWYYHVTWAKVKCLTSLASLVKIWSARSLV